MHSLAITGATGNLGGRVARRASDAGVATRLLVRDAARAPQLPQSSVAVCDYGDADAVRRALEGIDVLFMVSAAEAPDRLQQHRAFIDAAAAAGVRHVVYTSFVGAGPDATFTLVRDHWATEQQIRGSGMAFTFLRDNIYADFLPGMVGADGVIRGPAGTGRAAVVSQDDIADVAAVVLDDPDSHAGAIHDLTGPDALTLADVADIVAAATGRSVRYHDETVAEAYESRRGSGAPNWMLDAWVSTYTAIAAGELAAVSDAVPRLTGHPATSLTELLRRS